MKEALTKFNITKRPGPMSIMVETTYLTIISTQGGWKAEETVKYLDSTVDVGIRIRGQIGQEYEMTIEINSVKKTIKGKLKKNGINRIPRIYKLETFKL
ncbi:MAG: hypothetical protein AAGA43_12170 [Bacteroidota bacterium]